MKTVDYGLISQFAHVSRMEIAIRNKLRSNVELKNFTDGDILRVPDPRSLPSRQPPLITVCAIMMTPEFHLGAEEQVEFPMAVTLITLETRAEIEDNEKTHKDVTQVILNVLTSDTMLEETIYGPQALALRLDAIDGIDYAGVDTEEFGALLYQTIYFRYLVQLKAFTGQQA